MAHDRDSHAPRRLGVGAVVVLVLAALAVTVGIGIVRGAAGGSAVVAPTPSTTAGGAGPSEAPFEDGTLYVHVAGAVTAPGLYVLPVGARLVDVVAAAGGFAPNADRASVNLARTVDDGEQVLVPVVGAAPAESAAPPPGSSGSAGGVIDLNDADVAALDTLPRIGPALAERIVAWRDENGRFTSVDDLLSVPGIGEKIVDGLRDLVRA